MTETVELREVVIVKAGLGVDAWKAVTAAVVRIGTLNGVADPVGVVAIVGVEGREAAGSEA